VTAAQVQAMGRKYFDPKQQSIVVVGDPKAIDAQLESHGTFETFKP
jgi:predicted Zn-dependent peptidase